VAAEPLGRSCAGGIGVARAEMTAAAATGRARCARRRSPHRRRRACSASRAGPEPARCSSAWKGCGVCGSSLPAWEGRDWFDYPLAAGEPGPRGVGRRRGGRRGADVDPGNARRVRSRRAASRSTTSRRRARRPAAAGARGRPFRARPSAAPSTSSGAVASSRAARRGRRRRLHRTRRRRARRRRRRARDRALAAPLRTRARARRRLRAALTLAEAPTETFDRVVEASGVQATLDLAGPPDAGARPARDRRLSPGRPRHGRPPALELARARRRERARTRSCRLRRWDQAARNSWPRAGSTRLRSSPTRSAGRVGRGLRAARTRPDGFLKALVTP
jgi:hypothetical protein